MSSTDPHSPYLSHWRASYTLQDGYRISIENSQNDDCYAQWDWTDLGDDWETDYLPDEDDLGGAGALELRKYWGMRGCAVAITDNGDYMVAGTARLDMTGYDEGIVAIEEDFQLFLSVFDNALIDGPYNSSSPSQPSHGITSENWWLFGTSNDEGVSLRKWASGTYLPSNAMVVVGTQRRPVFPGNWRIYVGYMPYGSSNALGVFSEGITPLVIDSSNELVIIRPVQNSFLRRGKKEPFFA